MEYAGLILNIVLFALVPVVLGVCAILLRSRFIACSAILFGAIILLCGIFIAESATHWRELILLSVDNHLSGRRYLHEPACIFDFMSTARILNLIRIAGWAGILFGIAGVGFGMFALVKMHLRKKKEFPDINRSQFCYDCGNFCEMKLSLCPLCKSEKLI